jgi:hypothetical protein
MSETKRATPGNPIPGPVPGYHFVAIVNGTPVTRDGRPVTVGQDLTEQETKICSYGLHGSRRLMDAAAYAPADGAPVICKVNFFDVQDEQEDKLVAKRRVVLAMFPAHDFLIRMAESSACRAEQYAAAALDLSLPCPTEKEAMDIEKAYWEDEAELEFAKAGK